MRTPILAQGVLLQSFGDPIKTVSDASDEDSKLNRVYAPNWLRTRLQIETISQKLTFLSRLYRKFHCCCHIVERIGPLLLPKCSSFVPFFMAPQISYLQSCQKTTIGRERRRMWLVHILLMGKLRSKYGSISSTYPVTPSNCPQIRNGKKCDIVHTWGMV